LRIITEADLQGLAESEGPGHLGFVAVYGFDDAEVQSAMDN